MFISQKAYKILVLHAAKHPTSTVIGLLLGPKVGEVTLAIPLLHHWTSLAPMAEAGLALTETWAAMNNLKVLGVYEAPQSTADRTPSIPTLRIAEKISTLSAADALVLLINNTLLLTPTTHALLAFSSAGKSLPSNSFSLALDIKDAVADLQNAVKNKDTKLLFDFDDHLQDPSKTWLV